VYDLARDLPASWRVDGEVAGPEQSLVSVRLFQPVTGYRVVDRAINYGVLLLGLGALMFSTRSLTVVYTGPPGSEE